MSRVGSIHPLRPILSIPAWAMAWVLGFFLHWGEAQAASAAIELRAPWVRVTSPGVSATAGYVLLVNRSSSSDALIGASSSLASDVQIHTTVNKSGVARMRPVSRIALPAGEPVEFAPGGMHLMFVGLSASLVAGESAPVTLVFERAGEVTVRFAVRDGP